MTDGASALRPVLVRMLEGRVGSTLVMQLLATAPEIALDRVYPYEHSYLTYLVRLAGQLLPREPSGQQMTALLLGDESNIGHLPFAPEIVRSVELERSAMAALWTSFAGLVVKTPGVRYYAEKYWGDVDALCAAGISPFVLDLVRDPRDVVASVRAFNERTGRMLFGRATARDDDAHLRTMVAGMAFRLREMDAPLTAPRILVRYEDLVTDLEGIARTVGDLIGVELRHGHLQSPRGIPSRSRAVSG